MSDTYIPWWVPDDSERRRGAPEPERAIQPPDPDTGTLDRAVETPDPVPHDPSED